ncbi:MAG: DUF6541 family protein [Polyangia bacterium]
MRKWLSIYGAPGGAALAALLALASLLLPGSLPARWAAAAVLILAVPAAWRGFGSLAAEACDARLQRWRRLADRFGPYLLAAAAVLVSLGPVALGRMPVSQDHANHYFFTEILAHDMLADGRLFGWTDRLGLGYPFGDIHYTLCYLVTALPHLLSIGLVGLQASYAFGICLAWLLSSLAVVALARRLGAGPWAAALAGAINAFDVGGDREGGWTYSMFHGVWPQQLATAVWVLAILALWRLSERPDTRRLSLAALLAGISVWIHPMSAVVLLVGGTLLLAVRLLHRAPDEEADAARRTVSLASALLAGALIALFWAGRMMLGSERMWTGIVTWKQLEQLALDALTSGLFDHQLAVVSGLALVGAAVVFRRRSAFGILVLLLGAALLSIGAMDLVLGGDLGLAGGMLRTLQYRRFSIPLKPLWFSMAALGLSAAWRGAAAALDQDKIDKASRTGLRVLFAVLLAAPAVGLVRALPSVPRSPSARPLTLENAGQADHVHSLRRILEERGRGIDESGYPVRRAVYWEKPGHGGRYPLIALADAGFGLLPTVFPPAQNYADLARTTDPETMRRLGASLIVSRWPVEHDELEELTEIGREKVYRFAEPLLPPVRVDGPGEVEVASWKDEEKVLRLRGSRPSTSIVVALTPHPKWRARQGERDLETTARRSRGVTLTEIRAVADGEIRLEYSDTPTEHVFAIVGSLVLLGSLLGLLLGPRPLPILDWPEDRLVLLARVLRWALAGTGLALLAAAAIAGSAARESWWLAGEPRDASLSAVLHTGEPIEVRRDPEEFCVAPYTRDPGWGCSEADLEPRLAPAPARRGRIPSCLSTGIPPHGRTELVFALPREGEKLVGRIHRVTGEPGGKAEIRFSSGDESASNPRTEPAGKRFRLAIPPDAETVTFILRTGRRKPARLCIEAAVLSDR